MKIPGLSSLSLRPFGEIHDKDTQFTAFAKSNQEIIVIAGAMLVLGLVGYLIFGVERPREGTWRYAICKVFLERYSQYPTDLQILTAAEKQNSAQIGYLTTNSYGMRESRLMECFYNIDNGRVQLNRVTIDRKTLALQNPAQGTQSQQNPSRRMTAQDMMTLWEEQNQASLTLKYPTITFESFNRVIPLILSDEDLDRTMPRRLPMDLADLKY